MKKRRHHNNKGERQTKRGKTRDQLKRIAKRLQLPYREGQVIINPDGWNPPAQYR